jgi:autotransporter passenger strand-loop-strand repeat protein
MTIINGTASGSSFTGAVVSVTNGGTLEASVIDLATVHVESGGFASGNIVDKAGGALWVHAGGVASGTTLEAAGQQIVYGGTVYDTLVYHGIETVFTGGQTTGTQLSSGGQQYITPGASAVLTSVFYGAGLSVSSGGTAISAQISAGGSLDVGAAGATIDATTVHSGGLLATYTGDVLNGVTLDGGTVSAYAETIGGGVTFTADGGTLDMADTAAMNATISGFGRDATIEISGLAYAGVTSGAQLVGSLLTVTEGGNSATLTLDPSGLVSSDFVVSGNGAETTLIFHCFCAGTRIATPSGEVAVEDLRAGDPVRLADGRMLPVRWLARQTVAARFADPIRALPVRIAAGSLGEGLPRRDLSVSPGHALLLDGVLVQAGALLGLPGIARQPTTADLFSYYHVELDEHALLLAEGVAAESYLPAIEAGVFDNLQQRPDAAAATELPLPRVKAARQLPAALRARLSQRRAA